MDVPTWINWLGYGARQKGTQNKEDVHLGVNEAPYPLSKTLRKHSQCEQIVKASSLFVGA